MGAWECASNCGAHCTQSHACTPDKPPDIGASQPTSHPLVIGTSALGRVRENARRLQQAASTVESRSSLPVIG